MDDTLKALGGLLLRGIPTLILLTLLYLYLKSMFFKPVQEVLKKRREMTEGARAGADVSHQKASERTAEYQAKLLQARNEIYREQEEMRRQFSLEQTRQLDAARDSTRALVKTAREQIDQDVSTAKRELGFQAENLAEDIASTLLTRRAG